MDERLAAAYCRLRHGEPEPTEVTEARKAESDLIARTWRAEVEMGRDERRLLAKYRQTLADADAATLAAYDRCPRCSGNQTENGAQSHEDQD